MKDLQDFRQSLTIGIEVYAKDRDLAKQHNVYLMESIFGACHDELVRILEKFDKATKRRWAGRAAGAGVGRTAPPTEAKYNSVFTEPETPE